MKVNFAKMHGLGNDFIVIESEELPLDANEVCDRHTGIGADGILLVCKSDKADIKMRIINKDGSEAGMCGNGIRCFAKYVYERGLVNKDEFEVETLAGIMKPKLIINNGRVDEVRVNMGKPDLNCKSLPMKHDGEFVNKPLMISGKKLTATAVLMGVPHLIVHTPVAINEFYRFGKQIENLTSLFPNRTNVDFVTVEGEDRISVKTWERGCGATLACGTGACASAVASFITGKVNTDTIYVNIALGTLKVEIKDDVFMTGPASYVFDGSVEIV